MCRRLQQLGTGLTRGLTGGRNDELWVTGMRFIAPDSGEPVPAFFARERLDVGVERTGLRTPTTGRLPTI